MDFTDWRYRLVDGIDCLIHKVVGNREVPLVCNLERAMYAHRMSQPLDDLT